LKVLLGSCHTLFTFATNIHTLKEENWELSY